MGLKIKIQQDLKIAVKGKEELESLVLRSLLAAILNKEKEKRYQVSKERQDLSEKELEKESQLIDEEVIDVISSEIKKRKEAILAFGKGARQDLVEKEKKELAILEKYLPTHFVGTRLSKEELRNLAKEAIEKTRVKEIKDMGKVMSELMPRIKGKADGSSVSKIVKELLTPKND